ncbi:MOSC domain-containing protein [Bradyrhizobium japonicum]|uniref:MOSC domain-containing protein n=1 Tax=Bradyrhizobium japonicum TaxID=375 RepID=UPI0035E0CB1C
MARRRPRLPNLRQVHLIPSELFPSLLEAGFEVGAGDLGENVTTAGLDLERMPLGILIELGPSAVVELTGLRTPCVLIDRFRAGLKRQVLSSSETGLRSNPGCLAWYGPAGWSRLAIQRGFASCLPRFGHCRPCRKTYHGPKIDPASSFATHAGHADRFTIR